MILLLNGAFGIGKTTVARLLTSSLPRCALYDPEPLGIALQRGARALGRRVDDFQDLALWRTLTVAGVRATHALFPNVVVPMAFSDAGYLDAIRGALERFDATVIHCCLIAPVDVVYDRLRRRGADPSHEAWEFRRAAECCAVHGDAAFRIHIDAAVASPHAVAASVIAAVAAAQAPPRPSS